MLPETNPAIHAVRPCHGGASAEPAMAEKPEEDRLPDRFGRPNIGRFITGGNLYQS
jgi:hypothetical protein